MKVSPENVAQPRRPYAAVVVWLDVAVVVTELVGVVVAVKVAVVV